MSSGTPTDLAIERRTEAEGRTVLVLAGYIDLSTAMRVGAAISAALPEASSLEVDLAGVTFVDSSGLREFVLGYQQAKSAGRGFRLTGAHGSIRQVLEISGLYDSLTEGLPESPASD